MSSKSDSTILVPGPIGWEIWQGTPEKGFRRTLENGPMQPSGLEKIPSGNLVMAFPVREALAVPLKVQTTDEAMFEDLATMHLEKSGVRVEQGAGRLTDVFHAGHDDEQTSLLSVVLSAPREGSMPSRSPGEFDISARLFPMDSDAVTVWQELGRWVFAVTHQGKLSYFQALPGVSLDGDVGREIQLALTQLSLQGVAFQLDRIVVWTTGNASDPDDETVRSIGEQLSAEVSATPKPRPVLPAVLSKLVPADVRAERRVRAEQRKRNLLVAAVLLLYLGVAGFFAYKYYDLNKKVKGQKKELAAVRADYDQIKFFDENWRLMAPVVDSRHWPLTLLKRSSDAIPQGQIQNLRFKEYEANIELDENGNRVSRVQIRGEANDLKLATLFLERLKKELPDYRWDPPPPENDNKTNRWKFFYEGVLKGSETGS